MHCFRRQDHLQRAALRDGLEAGRSFAGKTDWFLSYQYQPRMEAGACKAESVTTKLALSMTMPRWSPPPGVSRDLIGRWAPR